MILTNLHQAKQGFITNEFTTIPLQRFLESSQASSFPSTHGQKPFKTYHSPVYPFSSEAPKKNKSFSIPWLVSLDFPLSLVNFSYLWILGCSYLGLVIKFGVFNHPTSLKYHDVRYLVYQTTALINCIYSLRIWC